MNIFIITLTLLIQMQPYYSLEKENIKQDYTKVTIKGDIEVQLKQKQIYLRQESDFLGASKMWSKFVLKNKGKRIIYVETTAVNEDRILLDDVFEGEACLQLFNIDNPNNLPCCKLSMGYSSFELGSITEIKPGKTLKFMLPVDHLSGGRCVRIRYWTGQVSPPISENDHKYIWVKISQ
jgi:hypothetical protein